MGELNPVNHSIALTRYGLVAPRHVHLVGILSGSVIAWRFDGRHFHIVRVPTFERTTESEEFRA